VPEKGSATFGVKLSAQPAANTTVGVSRYSGDTDITVVSGASLTFTPANWSTNQTVTLAAAEDGDYANGTATMVCSASGLASKYVTATEADNDTIPLIVTSLSAVTVPEAGTATFQVKLSAAPVANTTVGVSRYSGDTNIAVASGASLTFTPANWSTYQTVTLAASEDSDTNNGTATIRCSAAGLASKDITATERDNDTPIPLYSIVTSTNAVTVPEAGSATFQVRLSDAPATQVTVAVSLYSGDTSIRVMGGASLTFTAANWLIYQTVTLAASEDTDTINGTAIIRCSASGFGSKDVTATEKDND
jgi:cellulose 1,4-beta-cellobiosidase